ncbi:hypothetical protein, conserved [Babesia bigemina]|uniref:Uncharacterized protein n=1 Tax=Babesia bigemina TaxID=5866 RepID=A0A061CZZ7_BABBI|nr:hypothetical protein, conserved [Babesia bigemina]CDR94171.1 hypothetical protein, conserved [Babesia bigemina]|eukprot:XP_012766357.1 hypothetical protein, conserved [Babesia bigemina]
MTEQHPSTLPPPNAERAKGDASDEYAADDTVSNTGQNVQSEPKAPLDEETQLALDEVESEISQLLATGIQDTSVLGRHDECEAVWQRIRQQHGELRSTVDNELGIDPQLRDVVRAFAEGSVLPISGLITQLREHIAAHCKVANQDIGSTQLDTVVPLLVTRKNLGEAFDGDNEMDRLESVRAECMWVWESPSVDVFPDTIQERVNAAREARNLISRRYITLVKVRDAINSGDTAARNAANEELGAIYKKMLLEREKRERLEAVNKTKKVKKHESSPPQAKVSQAKDSKAAPNTKHEKATAKATAKPHAASSKQPNMLLNWLKSSSTTPAASSIGDDNAGNAPSTARSSPPATKAPTSSSGTGPSLQPTEVNADDYEDMGASEVQMVEIAKLMEALPRNRRQQSSPNASAHGVSCDTAERVSTADDGDGSSPDFDEFKKMCEDHRNAWMRYFTYVNTNRKFYVEASTNTASTDEGAAEPVSARESGSKGFVVDDLVNNIRDTIYGDKALKQERSARLFYMSDNEWKRPSMRLLISRSSQIVKPTEPLAIEPAMDYYGDSDEEWFEQYDVDDVEESGSEEEDDDEDENDWIVQDNPQQELQKHTLNLCEVVKVYCVNKNWHWIVDGVPQNNDECCSIEEAKKNGMDIAPCDYGFGYEGYTQNPISEFVSNMRGHQIIMTKEDVQEFLKLCHGKHTKKEVLISEFKNKKPFCSTVELREKFKKYICRMKVDHTPQRWLVTTEAAILFGIRHELDAILAAAMEQVLEEA